MSAFYLYVEKKSSQLDKRHRIIELLNVDLNNAELSEFTETFMPLLDKYAPKKQKYMRANNANFMTKSLGKTIMLGSKFRNRFLKEKTEESTSL